MKEQLKATTRRMIPILAQIVQLYIKWKNEVVSSYTRSFSLPLKPCCMAVIALKGYEQLREIIRRDYPVFSGHALEEYFRRKFAESGQWTRIGSWWDRKGENELDMVAENELTGEYAICEVKRQGGKIDLGCVAGKFAVFQRSTGKWQKVKPKFLALSLADM